MAAKKIQSSAVKALQKELSDLNSSPVEGFRVNVSSEENLFVWDVAIFGPPGTLYEGGYFKARLFFPNDYPYSPPSLQFVTKMFHPNIYETGEVCISILHSPGDDLQSGELASERWNPTQNVRTILISVISLLNEPNIYSAAHVEASVMYRRWKESLWKDNEYEKIVRSIVESTQEEARKDGVQVPRTLEEYCVSGRSDSHHDGHSNLSAKHAGDYDEDDDDDAYYGFDVEDEDDDELDMDANEEDETIDRGSVGADGMDSAMEEVGSESHTTASANPMSRGLGVAEKSIPPSTRSSPDAIQTGSAHNAKANP